jgi:hypothetical protein
VDDCGGCRASRHLVYFGVDLTAAAAAAVIAAAATAAITITGGIGLGRRQRRQLSQQRGGGNTRVPAPRRKAEAFEAREETKQAAAAEPWGPLGAGVVQEDRHQVHHLRTRTRNVRILANT